MKLLKPYSAFVTPALGAVLTAGAIAPAGAAMLIPDITVSMESNAFIRDPAIPGGQSDPQADTSGSIFSSAIHGGYGPGPGYPVRAFAFQNDEGASAVSAAIGESEGGFGATVLPADASAATQAGDASGGIEPLNSFVAESSAQITYTVENTTGVPLVGSFDYLVNEATLGFNDEGFLILNGEGDAVASVGAALLPSAPPIFPDTASAGYRYTLSLDGVEAFQTGAEMFGTPGSILPPTVFDADGGLVPGQPLPGVFGGWTAHFDEINDSLPLPLLLPGETLSVSVLLESYARVIAPLEGDTVRANFGDPNLFNFSGPPVGSAPSFAFTAIPEPSRAVLMAAGVLGMILRRKRRG